MEYKTLSDILQRQDKKNMPLEEIFNSLDKVVSEKIKEGIADFKKEALLGGVEKVLAEFKAETEKTKQAFLEELNSKVREAITYVNSLKPIKGDKPIVGVDYVIPVPKNGKNGKDGIGIDGRPGLDGKTPIKGVDYFTKEDIQSILDENKTFIEKLFKEKKQSSPIGTGGSYRPRAAWNIATFPQLAGTKEIIRKSGTLNQFYLPSVPVLYSETIRLNQGIPLSHGIDYTLSKNLITFTRDIQSDEYMEIRYQ